MNPIQRVRGGQRKNKRGQVGLNSGGQWKWVRIIISTPIQCQNICWVPLFCPFSPILPSIHSSTHLLSPTEVDASPAPLSPLCHLRSPISSKRLLVYGLHSPPVEPACSSVLEGTC